MVTLEELAQACILLIRVGCVFRFIYTMVRLTGADEDSSKYKKRARNVVIFYVLAESIWQIKEIMLHYYQ
ncbi:MULTISPECIES: mercury transporter [Paenibacillus]|uniref:mercury transporter n=1 Tax=Paenibacillus TaxID=44249 RepID=UPI000BA07AF2|nr:mercury transporter [Paenibacillus odorifer]OZQ77423.1 mercury transporter [Paenibacillus odorifer]